MKMTEEHKRKIALALKGKKKSLEFKRKMSIAAKKRNAIPSNNPNWKGDNIGYIGIHSWLLKNFKKTGVCILCKLTKRTVCALIKGKKYERKTENFIELCFKCHRNYDKTPEWNKSISRGKTGVNCECSIDTPMRDCVYHKCRRLRRDYNYNAQASEDCSVCGIYSRSHEHKKGEFPDANYLKNLTS